MTHKEKGQDPGLNSVFPAQVMDKQLDACTECNSDRVGKQITPGKSAAEDEMANRSRADVPDPGCLIKLAQLIRIADQQGPNRKSRYRLTWKDKAQYPVNHLRPENVTRILPENSREDPRVLPGRQPDDNRQQHSPCCVNALLHLRTLSYLHHGSGARAALSTTS